MESSFALKLRALFLATATLVCGLTFLCAEQELQTDASIQTTTQERIESEPWWPTKSTFPLRAYSGSASCIQCHVEEVSAKPTAMQRAAIPAVQSSFLASHPRSSTTLTPFSWTLAGQNLTVTQDSKSSTLSIAWDIGAGDLAHTFLYEHDDRWFQSQVTFYTRAHLLDTTTGLNAPGKTDLEAALGQNLTSEEVRKCFSCHTVHATTSAGFNAAQAEPGLGCEACHGPGREHVDTMKAASTHSGERSSLRQLAIFNPSSLSPVDAIDYCGSCHRTSVDARLAAGPNSLGSAAVRFQPYRLQQSRCWRATQSEKLTCTACHNPHEPLEKSTLTYDRICMSCHTQVHKTAATSHAVQIAAGVSSTSCVSCHMPKAQVSSMHGAFTDHRIRIVKPDEVFPD